MSGKKNKTWGTRQESVDFIAKFLRSGKKEMVIRNPTIIDMLKELEPRFRKTLRDHGLAQDWKEHVRKDSSMMPEKAYYAKEVLMHAYRVRQGIRLNKTLLAATEVAYMMKAVMNYNITIFEPDTYRGHHTLKSSSEGGNALKPERLENYKRWQAAAAKIWVKYPTLSKLQVATRIASQDGEKKGTIRRYIKKPVKSIGK
jgi:hypothetical protein